MTQLEYLRILFDDLGFSDAQRRAFVKDRHGVEALDELYARERSQMIDELKEMKERRRPQKEAEDDD